MAQQCFTGSGTLTYVEGGAVTVIHESGLSLGSLVNPGDTIDIPVGESCITYPDNWGSDGCECPAIPVVILTPDNPVVEPPPEPTGGSCDDPTFVELCPPAEPIPVEITNLPSDYEYVNSGWICAEGGTWVTTTTVYIDGVAGEPIVTDSGISCEEPAPLDQIDTEKLEICDPITKTIHIKVCQYTTSYDDDGVPTTVENEISYTDTNVKCDVDVVDVDTEFVCNETTDFYDMVQVTTTNGVPADPVVTPTTTPCDEDKPDFEQPRVCRDGTVHILTNQIDADGTVTELSAVDTGEVCTPPVKQTVDVNDCDLNPVSVEVDSVVKVEGVIQTKACPEDVIIKDIEYVCNEATGLLDKIEHTWVNGVAEADVVTATTYECDKFKDIEYREQCNPLTNKIDIVAVAFDENDVETELSVTAGTIECPAKPKPDCVESQEWTYGLDNTGTLFSEDNTIEITLSDGTSFVFNQPPATNWTPQMQVWGDEIQQAADDAGLAWFVETRYRDPTNPANLAGGGGFNGPPSLVVSNALTGMAWRYVNIQICPAQPVPVSAVIIDSSNPARIGFNLTTNGAVKGPLQRFFVCRECGEEPVWFLSDGVTPAAGGQIPNCYEPCGVISQLPSPPENECKFEISIACDNNNSTNTVDFTNTITRRATICNGNQIAVDYFEADPNDPNALIPYILNGDFVDCATGEPIVLPELPCTNFELTTAYTMVGDTELNGELRNREWHDTQPVSALTSDPEIATQIGRDFYTNHDFTLTPDTDNTSSDLSLNDTDNTAVELDIQIKEGLVEVKKGGWFRYANASEGYWAVYLAQCCIGDLIRIADSGGFSSDRTMEFYLPKGTHAIELVNIDSGGSNSSATFGYSTDNRVTWINDNTPPSDILTFGSEKLEEVCLTIKICEDTGEAFDALTGDPLDLSEVYTCSRMQCTPATPEPLEPAIQTGVSEIEVCADGKPAIKKLTIVDGVEVETFVGEDGLEITPTEWRAGSCTKSSECIKWRNKYVGIDNTGTSFTQEEVIEISDDDGVVGTFTVSASANNTEQLNKWIAEIQVFYPNALIEQRYAPTGGAGLPPPNDEITWQSMAARYVQFTACDGDSLPTSLRIIERNSVAIDQQMDVEVFFGEEQRGYICYTCGEEPTLFYSDGSVIPASEIPPCYVTCAEPFKDGEESQLSNSHLIEGCVTIAGEKVSHYTVVDDNGDALFTPRPLSDIGLEDCCDE